MAPAASRTKGRKRSVGTASSKKTKGKTKTKTKQQTEEVVCVSDDDCVISPIVILKQMYDMKRYEESEECFILDFDPYEAADLVNGKVASADDDVVLVSEKGQVACRDYPHPRHLCLKFPFHSTKHESYCKLCYCYVCDTTAPCKNWLHPGPGHCHASDRIIEWKRRRELSKLSAGMKTS
ncbi:hypothetical protein QQ045_003292 [Rhodiola kirilowii]